MNQNQDKEFRDQNDKNVIKTGMHQVNNKEIYGSTRRTDRISKKTLQGQNMNFL